MHDGMTGKTGEIFRKVPFWAWLIVVFLLGFLLRGGGSEPAHEPPAAQATQQATVWTCSMHPQVRQPGPGKCPICGMDLIPATNDSGDDLGPRRVRLSSTARELADILTAPVVPRRAVREVRLPGKVAFDETGVRNVSAWAGGRIDKLYVDFTGMKVRRGQAVAELYSPELFSAQEELLQAIKASGQFKSSSLVSVRESAESTVAAARRKLELLGMSAGQIDRLVESGEPSTHLDIFSPVNGTVVRKDATAGMYVKAGTTLYEVSDLGTVWVELEAYEQDLPWLSEGQQVSFTTPAYPGETFSGRIDFIDPVVDSRSRTAAVRVAAFNQGGRLKPGMLATATINSQDLTGGGDRELMIPSSAPLITGKRAVVYVEVPDGQGVFEGRDVVLGPRSGDYYIVREGLAEGERVVVNGAFKIDAAAQIAAKPSMMNPGEEKPAMEGMHGHAEKDSSPRPARGAAAPPAEELPAAFTAGLAGLYAAYFPVQDALASDDYEGALRAADKLAKALAAVDMSVLNADSHEQWMPLQMELNKARESITAAGDIAGARAGFDRLSAGLIETVKKFGGQGPDSLMLFHCPMAFDNRGAEWLQNHSDPRNPYYGKMMLKCKDRVSVLYPPDGEGN